MPDPSTTNPFPVPSDDVDPAFPDLNQPIMPVQSDEAKALLPQLVTQYRLFQSQKKNIEAELDAIKSKLMSVLRSLSEPWSDSLGFAKIIQPTNPTYPFLSDESTYTIQTMALSMAASADPALKQAGDSILALVEIKARKPYVLVK